MPYLELNKSRINKYVILLFLVFLAALALRLFKISFFEFKNDQLYAIQMGNDARKASFLVTHGCPSGVGLNNPPHLLYLMGIITFFTQDPRWISAFFMLISTLGLLLALRYFYLYLPLNYAFLASVILAFSPAFTTYTAYIWPQCLLPFFMVLYHRALYRLIDGIEGKPFLYLAALTAIICQLHMSGFFLFPALLISGIIYRKKIGFKRFFQSALAIFIICWPYIYHLVFEGELQRYISYADLSTRSFYWKVFREHIRMASIEHFRYYFRYDLNSVLNKSVGAAGFILYPLSCFLIAFFIWGVISYLSWLIKGRKLFNASVSVRKNYPLPFQVAGFLLISVTVSFLLLRIHTEPHYMIILFPAYAILTAFSAWKVWKFFWAKIIIPSSILATLILLVAVLLFVRRSGGHPHEYGPDYATLLKWSEAVWSVVPKGYCPELFLEGKGKFDKDTIEWVIMYQRQCSKDSARIPVKLEVAWNKVLMRYEYLINGEPNYND